MHEYGLCDGVVEAVLARSGGRRVSRVGVRVGVRYRVVPEIFAHAFEHSAEGTLAEGAQVEIVSVPAHGECRACLVAFDCADPLAACAACGGYDVSVSGGDELTLEWLELEPA